MSLYLWLTAILLVVAVLVPAAFDGKKRRADREAFAADLAALAARQGEYWAAHGRYAASVGVLGWRHRRGEFTLVRADSAGFAAVLESDHAIRPRVTCEVFAGPAEYAPGRAAVRSGEPACWGWRVWVIRTGEIPR